MSQTFTDENLLSWEAYASTGEFGLSVRPRIVFNCLSDPARPALYVEVRGDEADAEHEVHHLKEEGLRAMLRQAKPLD
jgi:hypothetical protein